MNRYMNMHVINELKTRFELIPVYPLAELAHVYTTGATKHEAEGWRDGMSWLHCIQKMLRHLFQWLMGSQRHEGGMHHLGSVAFYCFALMEYERTGTGTDDRRDTTWPDSAQS